MDLADVSSLSKYKDGYKYLLNAIDVSSRYAWSVPLKSKTSSAVSRASKQLFEVRQPILQSHKSNEFLNATVQNLLKK